jgi:hypothetical protein
MKNELRHESNDIDRVTEKKEIKCALQAVQRKWFLLFVTFCCHGDFTVDDSV